MKCVILAAGYATRLYPLTENFPKPLLDIKGKGILEWLIGDIEQIEEMERTLEGQQLNQAKELLAYSLTELVHGKEAANQAQDAAKAIFTSGSSSENMPTTAIPAADLQDGGIGILTLMVKAGLCASNGEARRLVQQGGVSVNNEKVTDPKAIITLDGETIIKKGKKVFHKVVVE